MGVRTRGLDIKAASLRDAADRAAREEAARVVEHWLKSIGAGKDISWSPTIRAVSVIHTHWVRLFLLPRLSCSIRSSKSLASFTDSIRPTHSLGT
jgi:hypothetical protein